MNIVYIAGAYRGNGKPDTIFENIIIARKYAKKYWRLGYAVFCPHMNTAFMDGACNDKVWLKGDIEIMKRCDIVVMLPNFKNSQGAIAEYAEAKRIGLQIIKEK